MKNSCAKAIKDYLHHENIYKGKRNISKQELIDMIITEKNIEARYKPEDDLPIEEASAILKNSRFVKSKSKENINPPETKIIQH